MNSRELLSSRYWTLVCVSLGTILYLWLLSNSWVGRDQIILLKLGQDFAKSGTLDPVAKGMSGGGMIPGSLLQILIGVPLMIWQDYRAPLILIGLTNLLAGIVVYRVARRELDAQTAMIFFALYWLSPWRLTHAAMLWEPAYLFLPAALHVWSASKLRLERNLLASFILGAVLLMTPQLHGSFLFLWILTAFLFWKMELKVHWSGLMLGALAGCLTLIPAIYAIATSSLPSPMPSEGFIGKGFVYVAPFLKGILYWLRLPTLDVAIKEVVYLQNGWAGTAVDTAFVSSLRILQGLGTATIGLSAIAAWWYFKRLRVARQEKIEVSWMERYAWYAFLALIISGGLAPVTLQSWHVVIGLPAGLIAPALWASHMQTKYRRFDLYFVTYCAVGILIVLVTGFGKPAFRRGDLPKEVYELRGVLWLFPAHAASGLPGPSHQ